MTAWSCNRSRHQIDTDAGYRTCALQSSDTMRLAIIFTLTLFTSGKSDLLRDSVHVTSAAARPNNELWCYKCRADVPEDKCTDLRPNNSALIHKCHNDRRMCMVKRFSYTTSNENSTTNQKMWALERSCTKQCEPGCIVIGERTKLYACTSCCSTSLCNYGSGAAERYIDRVISMLFLLLLFLEVPYPNGSWLSYYLFGPYSQLRGVGIEYAVRTMTGDS